MTILISRMFMVLRRIMGKLGKCIREREGIEAQLGKEHIHTKTCAANLAICFARAGEKEKLRKLVEEYPHIIVQRPVIKKYL